jgi:hypothetical protein
MQISAYLDGQLSTREMNHIAHKIQTRPEYRQAFEEIKRTRLVLRNTPRRKPPHNYYLTPQMIKKGIRQPLVVRQFGLASAFATFILVVILMGDLVSNLSMPFGAMASRAVTADQAAPASEAAAESVPVTEGMEVFQETKPPEVIYWGTQTAPDMSAPAPDTSMGGMGGGGGGDTGGAAGAVPQVTPGPAEESNQTGEINPTPTQQSTGETVSSAAETNNSPILGIAPTDQQGEPLSETYILTEEESPNKPTINWLPIIEISLAILAVIFGIISLALRRRL